LDWGETYTVTVATGVRDTSGNPMAADVVWSFSTEEGQGFYLRILMRNGGQLHHAHHSGISASAPGSPFSDWGEDVGAPRRASGSVLCHEYWPLTLVLHKGV
jgi:hypothetical protein